MFEMQGREISIGIYVRESRDDNGENYDTIENQRDMLIDYVKKNNMGRIYSIYTDDNVSGSAFERSGLTRLKEDVLESRIHILLLKDLSRLGRNNAKTLQFLDFMEECGVRVVSSDGRYDSLRDNDTVGIETWINERYVRDLSRKIRSCLHFKIQRGEYIGNAPFGYRKMEDKKNKLCIDASEAETVRLIYRLYRSGMGYTTIAARLDEMGCKPPDSAKWNRMTVRRILSSSVYIGDTVQGVSERVSFKSKKTRRLPNDQWVITKGTHDAIVSVEEFQEIQKLRESKVNGRSSGKGTTHVLNGILWCGGCGSTMYARKRKAGIAYVCGNYFRNGRAACTSHLVYEEDIRQCICSELMVLLSGSDCLSGLQHWMEKTDVYRSQNGEMAAKLERQLALSLRQQEILYKDRLEERISEQLFIRMNKGFEERLKSIESEIKRLENIAPESRNPVRRINGLLARIGGGELTNELAKLAVSKITVYDLKMAILRFAEMNREMKLNGRSIVKAPLLLISG